FLEFVRHVARIWREQPVFQRRRFFQGRRIRGTDIKDISWLAPTGEEMTDEDWHAGFTKCLGVRLAGDLIGDVDERGDRIGGDTILLLLNAHHEAIPFTLPRHKTEQNWELLLDTFDPGSTPTEYKELMTFNLQGRSLAVFRTRQVQEAEQPLLTPAQVEGLLK